MLTNKLFQNGTVALNYVEGPASGPPLLLLHGITQRWQEFIQVIPALLSTYHVYAVDFRGHGKSGRAVGSYNGENYSRDVLEFIDQVVGEPVILFGHSLGGMVSLYLGANYQSRLRAQILGDCIVFGSKMAGTVLPSMFQNVYDLIAGGKSYEQLRREVPEMCLESPLFGKAPFKMFPGCDEPYLAAWARALSQLDPDVLKMTIDGRTLSGWNPDELIAKIACPTLLIQADPKMGGLMTDNDVARIRAANPDVQHVHLNGVGHSLHMFDPAPVLRALMNFLVTLEP
jgi:pimeloyl-ACP methyl ester carboxylesterase